MPRADWLLALGLAALALATRVPFAAHLLPTWDAVQFALALNEYDIVKHQPHPPGYILYVAAGRALEWLVGDPTRSLTWLAILASALTVLLVYRLGWLLYGRPAAAVAALGLVASPLFWFYGVVGLSYAAEAALATWVATLAWQMRTGQPRFLVWSAVAIGLAGGVRQSILLLLLPLWLLMAWEGFRRGRPVGAGCALIGLVSAGWLVPMIWLTGGVERYLGAGIELFDSTVRATSILGHGGRWFWNGVRLGEALVLGTGLLAPLLVWGVVRGLRRFPRIGLRGGFLVAWILPAVVVYTLVHFGQDGYLLTLLPACYLLIARVLVGLAARPGPGELVPRWAPISLLVASVLLAHTAFFVVAGPVDVPFPPASAAWSERWAVGLRAFYRFRLWATTAGGLAEREAVITTYVEAVRRGFDPADTVLVTELGNPRSYPWFRHVMYYLPEFPVYHLRVGDYSPGFLTSRRIAGMAVAGAAELVLPAHTHRLVWVVDYWNPLVPRPPGLVERPLAYGRWLYVLPIGRRPVEHAGYRLMPVTAVARTK